MHTQEYEYRIEVVQDSLGGGVNLDALTECISKYAKEGWRLVTVYSNELGKNALSVAGLGVNSTLEQSVLFFERKVQPKVIAPQFTFNISECNVHSPLALQSATITLDKTKSIFLSVYCPDQHRLSGIECAVIISNAFGTSIVCEPICFVEFKKGNDIYHTSAPYPIDLPEHITQSISNISIIVKKYILDNAVVTVDSVDLQSNKEYLQEKAPQFNYADVVTQLETLPTAREIHNFIKQYNLTVNDFFPQDIVAKLEAIAKTERIYGNMRKDALILINKYITQFASS